MFLALQPFHEMRRPDLCAKAQHMYICTTGFINSALLHVLQVSTHFLRPTNWPQKKWYNLQITSLLLVMII